MNMMSSRPLPISYRSSLQYWNFTSEQRKNNMFLWNLNTEPGTSPSHVTSYHSSPLFSVCLWKPDVGNAIRCNISDLHCQHKLWNHVVWATLKLWSNIPTTVCQYLFDTVAHQYSSLNIQIPILLERKYQDPRCRPPSIDRALAGFLKKRVSLNVCSLPAGNSHLFTLTHCKLY